MQQTIHYNANQLLFEGVNLYTSHIVQMDLLEKDIQAFFKIYLLY